MTSPCRRTGAAVLAALVGVTVALPAIADDGDKLKEQADTTWRILPAQRLAHVSTVATVQNMAKPSKKMRWYYDDWNYFWLPSRATDVRFGGKGVKARRVKEKDEFWDQYAITFPKIWYKQKQKITSDFELTSAGTDTDASTRVEEAYVHVCWYGNGADTGSTKLILPAGFETWTYDGQPTIKRTADSVILQSPGQKDPGIYEVCTEAFALDKLENVYLAGEDGQGLITVSSWPGQTSWSDYVVGEVEAARPWLETHLGSDFPLSELTFREVGVQGRYSAQGDARPIGGVIGLLEEDFATGVVAERLARTWFGPERISEPWLAEGLAMWAGRSAVGERCPVPALPEAGPGDPVVDPDALIPRTAVDLDDLDRAGPWGR